MSAWPNGRAAPQSDAPWSRLPRAVRALGVSGRFTMHLLLSILEQPASDSPRWWVVSGRERVAGYGGEFSQVIVAAYADPPSPAPSQIVVAKEYPLGDEYRARRVVSTVTPQSSSLHLVEYRAVLRWYRELPVSLQIEPRGRASRATCAPTRPET